MFPEGVKRGGLAYPPGLELLQGKTPPVVLAASMKHQPIPASIERGHHYVLAYVGIRKFMKQGTLV